MATILKDAVQDAAFKVYIAKASRIAYEECPAAVQANFFAEFVTNQLLHADPVTREQFLTTVKGVL